jgi:hypothetical protein
VRPGKLRVLSRFPAAACIEVSGCTFGIFKNGVINSADLLALAHTERAAWTVAANTTGDAELQTMIDAVDLLADDMKKKLRRKARQGYHGGLDPANRRTVAHRLHEHASRLTTLGDAGSARQAVDVCNLALMLWILGGLPRA